MSKKKNILLITSLIPLLFVVLLFSFIKQDSYDDFQELKISFDNQLVFSLPDSSNQKISYNVESLNGESFNEAIEYLTKNTGKKGFDLEPIYHQFKECLQREIYKTTSLDTINSLLNFCEEMKALELLDKENGIIYSVFKSDVLSAVANTLGDLATENKSLKFTYRFKSVYRRCTKEKYNPGILNSSLEKVVYNLVNNRYSYLVSRFWTRTSFTQKSILFTLLVFGALTSSFGTHKLLMKLKQTRYEK